MISQHSTNNNTVSFGKMLAEALRRSNWMIALSALASFLAEPVCFLFVLQSYENIYSTDYAADRTAAILETGSTVSRELSTFIANYLSGLHATLQLIVVLVGAVIVSVFGFRYLYHRRSADLYGSMPATRGRQFLAQYLAGFLIWFVPFVTGAVLILLIGALRIDGYFGVYATELVKVCGLMIFNFLIVYHACLVAVLLSGNTVNALLNSGLYGLLPITAYGIYYLYCSSYFETFYHNNGKLAELFAGLSPLAAPIVNTYYLLDEDPAEYLTLLITAVVLMIANFFLAKKLHDLRPSELAERGLECKPIRILLRGVVSMEAGLLLALFFEAMTNSSNSSGWVVFGCVFGTVLVFAVLNVIYHASFRELFAHRVQMAVCVVLAGAVILCYREDIFGYDTYVADESNITGLAIESYSLHDDGFTLVWDENGQRYSYVYNDTPTAVVSTDPSEIRQTLVTLTSDSREKDGNSLELNVRVFTKTGSYSRTYRIYRSDKEQLTPLLETDAFRDTYYPASMGSLKTPPALEAYSLDGVYCQITDTEKIQEIYEAYQEDFREHYCADLIWSEAVTSDAVRLNFYGDEGLIPTLMVYPCFTRTLTLLEEWYPERAWTLDDLEIASIHFSIGVYADTSEESVTTILDTLGVNEKTRAELADLIAEAKTKTDGWSDWWTTDEDITDPDLIAELAPYLSTSEYSETSEMADLGSATVRAADYETISESPSLEGAYDYSDELELSVYVEKEKVPAEVIKLLLEWYLKQ